MLEYHLASTVNVLKFQTLVACQKGLDKRQSETGVIRAFPVCYSDMHFVNSGPENQNLDANRKRKVFEIFYCNH